MQHWVRGQRGQQYELTALTGLRGVAASVVALGHFGIVWWHPALNFLTWTNGAVDVFFVLSGFTLCYAYGIGGPIEWRRYLTARVARIYPLYAVLLVPAALIPLSLYAGRSGAFAYEIAAQFLLVQEWPGIGTGRSFIGPAWSISVEWFLYFAIFPVLAVIGKRWLRIPPPLVCLAAATALMAGSLYLLMRHFDGTIITHVPKSPPISTMYAMMGRGVIGFVAGFMVYLAFRRSYTIRRAALLSPFALAAAVAIFAGAHFKLIRPDAIMLAAPILVLCAATGRNVIAAVLSTKPIVYLGEISYGIYLLHTVVMDLTSVAIYAYGLYVPNLLASYPYQFAAFYLVVTLALAALSHKHLEEPAQQAIKRLFGVAGNFRRPRPVVEIVPAEIIVRLAAKHGHLNDEGRQLGRPRVLWD